MTTEQGKDARKRGYKIMVEQAVHAGGEPASAPPPRVGVSPSDVQRSASDPNVSAWVDASAGSGKTKVLADRVTRLLLEGVSPSRILCLTFTRAAAAEMSIRITDRLADWAICSDDALRDALCELMGKDAAVSAIASAGALERARRLLAAVLECPGGMKIRTIHAFCQELLRRFPVESGLPPHFAVIEEAGARALREEARDELLQAASLGGDDEVSRALRYLVRDMAASTLAEAMDAATSDMQRVDEALEEGGEEAMAGRIYALLGLTPSDTEESIRRAAMREAAWQEGLLETLRLVSENSSDSFAKNAEKALSWLGLPDFDAQREEKFGEYCDVFLTKKDEPRGKFANKKLREKHPDADDILRREAARLAAMRERMNAAQTAGKSAAVMCLALALAKRYQEKKTALAVLDYDDLIRLAGRLLKDSGDAAWVLYKLDGGIDHVLLDEAQDTSSEQWRIVRRLTDEFFSGRGARGGVSRSLFVVGDGKQSIYSFRKADPQEFENMRRHFSEKIPASDRQYREVPMNVSFRSAPAVLRAVDAVFSLPEARDGVSSAEVKHYPYNSRAAGRVEVWPLVADKDESTGGEGDEDGEEISSEGVAEGVEGGEEGGEERYVASEVKMAEILAERISCWLRSGTPLFDGKSGYFRAMRAGDVMVLVQSRRGRFVSVLVRRLKRMGVPVTGVDRMKLIEQLAVLDILSVLRFMLLPEDDLALAEVLRGPFIGCDEDALMEISVRRKGTLWRSLAEEGERGGQGRLIEACRWLGDCLAMADTAAPLDVITRILSRPCPADALGGRRAILSRLGPDARDPLAELVNAAEEFGGGVAGRTVSLQAFLHWLVDTDFEIKRELDSGAGQVRITTVHSSKGLEAPVVVIPDATRMPDSKMLPRVLWHQGEGKWTPFYAAAAFKPPILADMRGEARRKQMQEYRRLLYVALTRSARRLYVGGWERGGGKKSKTDESWYGLVLAALRPLHEPWIAAEGDAVVAFADNEPDALQTQAAPVAKAGTDTPVPLWARIPAAPEPPLRRPLAPSRAVNDEAGMGGGGEAEEPPSVSPLAAGTDNRRFARGRIIHRLLQSLPDMPDGGRERAAMGFLSAPGLGLAAGEREEIVREVMAILQDSAFAPLFASGSRAEVPITGFTRDGTEVSGQIDRLRVTDDEVLVVDYKTNRPPPPSPELVPAVYRRQMAAYAALLREIYPSRRVRCFLLWTYGPIMMEIGGGGE